MNIHHPAFATSHLNLYAPASNRFLCTLIVARNTHIRARVFLARIRKVGGKLDDSVFISPLRLFISARLFLIVYFLFCIPLNFVNGTDIYIYMEKYFEEEFLIVGNIVQLLVSLFHAFKRNLLCFGINRWINHLEMRLLIIFLNYF